MVGRGDDLVVTRNEMANVNPITNYGPSTTTSSLSNKGLENVPPYIFDLTNLTTLDLSNNRLVSLPSEILNLTNLTVLNLSNNLFSDVPIEVFSLPNLAKLDLSGNGLRDFPRIFESKSITTLNLCKNKYKNECPAVFNLKGLIDLNLSQNKIKKIQSEISELKNLVKLDLGGNNICALPKEIENLKNLSFLNLEGNGLKNLPREMEKLTELAYLDLSGNELSSLPRMLSKLTHLSHIRIDHRDVARFSSSNDAILSEPTKNAADGPHPSQGSDVSRSDERDVFISHNSSDSILAILIAKELEHRGYPVWYFERDKVSIISYLEATNLALKASKTMLLLITEHSVTAHEVLTEVQNAHKERIPIIPVRYKIEHDDYRKRSLDMDQAIGCGGEIKIEVENIDRAIDEIIAGLRHLHILPKSN